MNMWPILFIIAALFVGWATPQPEFAARITNWVVTKWQELFTK